MVITDIAWIEKRLRQLNGSLLGGDIPNLETSFLLDPHDLRSGSSQRAIVSVAKTCLDHAARMSRLDIPFRNADIAITPLVGTAGEFSADDRRARILLDEAYVGRAECLRTILVHEVCHLLLDHNGLNSRDPFIDEASTDLCAFILGFGAVYLAGQDEIVAAKGRSAQVHFGYLGREASAWVYMRTAAQRGVSLSNMSRFVEAAWRQDILRSVANLRSLTSSVAPAPPEPRDFAVIVCDRCGVLQAATVIRPVTFVKCEACGMGQTPLRCPMTRTQTARLALLGKLGGDHDAMERLLESERKRNRHLSEEEHIRKADFRLMRDRGAHLLAPNREGVGYLDRASGTPSSSQFGNHLTILGWVAIAYAGAACLLTIYWAVNFSGIWRSVAIAIGSKHSGTPGYTEVEYSGTFAFILTFGILLLPLLLVPLFGGRFLRK